MIPETEMSKVMTMLVVVVVAVVGSDGQMDVVSGTRLMQHVGGLRDSYRRKRLNPDVAAAAAPAVVKILTVTM